MDETSRDLRTDGSSARHRRQARVACVGDSITWGAFIWHRKRDSYPAQLGRIAGDAVTVGNFGMSGHAVQTSADFPYRISKPYRASTAFEPDVVLIMLGTNDSRGNNWKGIDAFVADYRDLVAHYRSLPSAPRVFLMTPSAVFGRGRSGKVRYGMNAAAIQEMSAAIRQLARDEGLGLVDAYAATSGHPEAFRFDGVHPGANGAALIARAACDVLMPELAAAKSTVPDPQAGPVGGCRV